MVKKILYADDEEDYLRLVKMFLERENYEVLTANDGEKVLELVCAQPDISLIILDVMMPKLDGWQTCEEIRKISDVPILMLTALNDVKSEVYGIENGADDYIAKPFSHEVFMARVNALIRRTSKIQQGRFMDEGMEFDELNNSVHVHEKNVVLTPKEYELLKYLVINKKIVLTRERMLNHIWGFDYFGDPRTVDTHIKSLRAKLGQVGDCIITIRNKGYSYRGESK